MIFIHLHVHSSYFTVEGMHTIISPTEINLPLTKPRKTRVSQVSCGRSHSLILTDEEGGK